MSFLQTLLDNGAIKTNSATSLDGFDDIQLASFSRVYKKKNGKFEPKDVVVKQGSPAFKMFNTGEAAKNGFYRLGGISLPILKESGILLLINSLRPSDADQKVSGTKAVMKTVSGISNLVDEVTAGSQDPFKVASAAAVREMCEELYLHNKDYQRLVPPGGNDNGIRPWAEKQAWENGATNAGVMFFVGPIINDNNSAVEMGVIWIVPGATFVSFQEKYPFGPGFKYLCPVFAPVFGVHAQELLECYEKNKPTSLYVCHPDGVAKMGEISSVGFHPSVKPLLEHYSAAMK